MELVFKCQVTKLDWYFLPDINEYQGFDHTGSAQRRVMGIFLPSNPLTPCGNALTQHWCTSNANTNNESQS